MKKAVRQCLKEGVPVEFLQKYAIEVTNMIYQQMTFEEYDQMRFDDGKEVGKEIGKIFNLISLIRKKMIKNQSPEIISDAVEEPLQVVEPIMEAIKANPHMSDEEILEIIY